MQHRALANYFEQVEQAIFKCSHAYVEQYTEEIITPERANLRIRIRFENGCLLEINEAVVSQNGVIVSLDYRYHCQDKHNQLIFRYDNTPHFPGLSSYPHHKHLPDSVVDTRRPDIEGIIDEVMAVMSQHPEKLSCLIFEFIRS